MEVRQYQTVEGRTPITEWLEALPGSSVRGRIVARPERLGLGLKADWKSVGSGACELRIDVGPAYRVYYAHDGVATVVLLCGGDKGTHEET